MNVIQVQELQPYSYSEIIKYIDETSINKLIALNMLRKLGRKDIIEIGDLLHEDAENILTKSNGEIYVYKFVGMVTIKQVCIISYPKYCKQLKELPEYDADYDILRELIKVIRKYNSIEQQQEIEYSESGSQEFNLLSYTLDLLDDYRQNGLYINHESIIEINGRGNILWTKTIAEQQMYLSDKNYIYLDFFTENNTIDCDDFVRNLHATVLTLCSKELAPVLHILDEELIDISTLDLDNFGDKTYILHRLYQEYGRQFETRKQAIILKLIEYIQRYNTNNYQQSNMSFVITTSMNMIWEKVCATVLGDCRKERLKDKGLTYSKNSCKDKSIVYVEDIMPNPVWHHHSGKLHEAKDTLTLDIIVIDKNSIEIYDAKYYDILFNENSLKRQPGVGDITKQYLYEKAYQEFAKENGLTITKNAFLIPAEVNEELLLGKVTIDLFDNNIFNGISIILLPVRKMYQKFIAY